MSNRGRPGLRGVVGSSPQSDAVPPARHHNIEIMEEQLMQVLTLEQAQQLEGGGFWRGFVCGLTAVATIGIIVSPDPISKLAFYSLSTGWAACLA